MSDIVVTGGRDFDKPIVGSILDHLKFYKLHVGDARGADAEARKWAENNGKPMIVYHADWDAHGRAAGPRRNLRMLQEASYGADGGVYVVAFPGGRGTANCVSQARAMGIVVIEVQP